MKWEGRRESENVEDARGQRVAGGAPGIGLLINLVLRMFGIKGVLVLAVLGLIGWGTGLIKLSPSALIGGRQVQSVRYQPSAAEQERFTFVKVVLADTEDIWTKEFSRIGRNYQVPELVVYHQQYPTACGMGDARMGPFIAREIAKSTSISLFTTNWNSSSRLRGTSPRPMSSPTRSATMCRTC